MAKRITYDADARLADADRAEKERKRQDNAELALIHARRAALTTQENETIGRVEREDRERVSADLARRQEQAEGMQRAQWAWAKRRDALVAERDELRRLLVSARGAVISAPLAEARIAAAEVAVYDARLAAAELAIVNHAHNQPAGF